MSMLQIYPCYKLLKNFEELSHFYKKPHARNDVERNYIKAKEVDK